MRKEKYYKRAFFSADAIQEAYSVFRSAVPEEARDEFDEKGRRFVVEVESEEWEHDTESEFFVDYRRGTRRAVYKRGPILDYYFRIQVMPGGTLVEIGSLQRAHIELAFEVFEKYLSGSTLPEPVVEATRPKVFVGHGHSSQWRDLKDHLQDQHGFEVVAYEVGARAGHAIRDILEDMLNESSFAVLVMSAEDKDAEGNYHARSNVIHELGLFQGRIGFGRAVVLLEQGTQEFSNIFGIQQIRYSKGAIRETFGDVLATVRREFEIRATDG